MQSPVSMGGFMGDGPSAAFRETEHQRRPTVAPVMLNLILLSLHTVEHTEWLKDGGGPGLPRERQQRGSWLGLAS